MMWFAFLSGVATMGFAVSAAFFLRSWKHTGESLFLCFAAAFLLLGAVQALLVLIEMPVEERSLLYLGRLAAFLLILFGIWQKNRAMRP